MPHFHHFRPMAHFRFLAYAALSISECFSARIFSTDFRLKSALQPCAFRPQSQRENPSSSQQRIMHRSNRSVQRG
jgi:hypothetical protein